MSPGLQKPRDCETPPPNDLSLTESVTHSVQEAFNQELGVDLEEGVRRNAESEPEQFLVDPRVTGHQLTRQVVRPCRRPAP